MRGATAVCQELTRRFGISIHAPHAGSDSWQGCLRCTHCYFNPRSPCGERPPGATLLSDANGFQSTLPMRGATIVICFPIGITQFQSTLPMRGATKAVQLIDQDDIISIHAPHAGSDKDRDSRGSSRKNFNPRSPCGERRKRKARGHRPGYFNPRSPCGERLSQGRSCSSLFYFNPRSPCGERQCRACSSFFLLRFQSTLPMRGATRVCQENRRPECISIHAPHAGSDLG